MTSFPAKLLLLSFVLAGLFVMPVQAQSVPKDYRDWSVSCSNIKTCTAVSISGLNEMGISARPRGVRAETEMGWLWLELEAGPAAQRRQPAHRRPRRATLGKRKFYPHTR